jgi:predicted nucleic acid-binding protein
MILVDSNVLMYAAGASHPHKEPSVALLERVAAGELDASIDAEVLQEIVHRYRAIGRWKDGRHVYDHARALFATVLPVTADVMDQARALLDGSRKLNARDAVHAAVVLVHGLDAICSWDRDYDGIRRIRRIEP